MASRVFNCKQTWPTSRIKIVVNNLWSSVLHAFLIWGLHAISSDSNGVTLYVTEVIQIALAIHTILIDMKGQDHRNIINGLDWFRTYSESTYVYWSTFEISMTCPFKTQNTFLLSSSIIVTSISFPTFDTKQK